MPNLTREQILILRHTIGVGDDGLGKEYRNHYVHPPTSDIEALVAADLFRLDGANVATGDMPLYRVTSAGREAALAGVVVPKLTAGQQRYRHWLDIGDALGMNFAEYLRWLARRKKEAA